MHTTPMRYLLTASSLALALGLAQPAIAGSYLDALKAEAKSDAQPKAQTPPREGRPALRTDDQVQMEHWLQQEYMGTYVFYQKLSDTKKMAVYRTYRDGAPIEELRTKINELLKK